MDTTFSYNQKVAASLGVTMKVPEGFHEQFITHANFIPDPVYASRCKTISLSGMLYNAVMESDDHQAMIMYHPMFPVYAWNNYVRDEIAVSLGDENMDVTKLVKVVDRDEANPISNADKAAFYRLKTKDPFYGRYNYFQGVYLRKKGFPALLLKIAMTKEGTKNVDKYLEALMNSIHYGDEPVEVISGGRRMVDKIQPWEFDYTIKRAPKNHGGIIVTPDSPEYHPNKIRKIEAEGYDAFNDSTMFPPYM